LATDGGLLHRCQINLLFKILNYHHHTFYAFIFNVDYFEYKIEMEYYLLELSCSRSQRSVEKNTYVKVKNNLNYRFQKFERKAVADFWTCGWSFAKRDSDTKKLGTFGETNVLDSG
jgi:hypothetical protein